MARRTKTIPIDGRGEVTVKEVAPYTVYLAMTAENKVDEILAIAKDCINMDPEKQKGLYASEIEPIVDAFLEVNTSFLAIAEKLFVKDIAINALKEISKVLPRLFVDSYKEVMAQPPGITDGLPL
jgi:hypothetical protein